MPGQHAVLSPSSAERWMSCPASIKLVRSLDLPAQSDTFYAREGTCAHALAEIKASLEFGKISKAQFRLRRLRWARDFADILAGDEVEIEMERHTDAYVDLIRGRLAVYPDSQVMFEQKLDAGVPSCWGTSDTVIVSPRHVEIVDFKYGQGYAVPAAGNPQLRLYALGALDTYGDILGDTEAVYLTIHQPRMGHVLTDEMTPEALRAWRVEKAIPRAEEALGDDAEFGPSDKACKWCPASGRCPAQLKAVFDDGFVEPHGLTPEEMAEIIPKLDFIRTWMKAFEQAALHMAYSEGIEIPGYKVVLSGGRRSIKDPAAALQHLATVGYTFDEVGKITLRGIGELEKLIGKEKFAEMLDDYIEPPEGKPALAPLSDKRPPAAPNTEAQKEFLL